MRKMFNGFDGFIGFILWISPSIITIIAFAFAVLVEKEDFPIEGDLSDFYSSFIALCTTFIVGFQIYSTMELNKRIRDLDEKDKELEQKTEDIDEYHKKLLECKYYNAYTIGLSHFNNAKSEPKYYWNSLRAYCNALLYATEGGHDIEEAIDALCHKMQECLSAIKDYHKDWKNITDENEYIPVYPKRVRMADEINDTLKKIHTNLGQTENSNFTSFKCECIEFFLKEGYCCF